MTSLATLDSIRERPLGEERRVARLVRKPMEMRVMLCGGAAVRREV
jgi:hypothetical protein